MVGLRFLRLLSSTHRRDRIATCDIWGRSRFLDFILYFVRSDLLCLKCWHCFPYSVMSHIFQSQAQKRHQHLSYDVILQLPLNADLFQFHVVLFITGFICFWNLASIWIWFLTCVIDFSVCYNRLMVIFAYCNLFTCFVVNVPLSQGSCLSMKEDSAIGLCTLKPTFLGCDSFLSLWSLWSVINRVFDQQSTWHLWCFSSIFDQFVLVAWCRGLRWARQAVCFSCLADSRGLNLAAVFPCQHEYSYVNKQNNQTNQKADCAPEGQVPIIHYFGQLTCRGVGPFIPST